MRKILNSYSLLLLGVILISMATSPAIFLGEGNINLLLIAVMSFSLLVVIARYKLYRSEIWLLLFMVSIITIPPLAHPESMRWSTVLYSFMFSLTFLAYNRLLRYKIFNIESYLSFLKYIIYGYAIVLLIQQFCVLTGLPIFNVSNYDPVEPWKLNSLSAEPSHSARIVALLMYCYIVIKELISNAFYDFRKNFKKDKWVWLGFLWTMLTMGSATAFVFIAIFFLKFIRFKMLVQLGLLVVATAFFVDMIGVDAFDRVLKVFKATLTLDPNTIIAADHSASSRIAPMIYLAEMVDLTTFNGWFGHGIDNVSTFMSSLISGVPDDISGGGMFQLWFEYGFVSFILFVIFSFKCTYRKEDNLSVIFWFFLVFMYGVNSQIVWLCIILLYTNRYFSCQCSQTRKKK
jgi:hypothetical protein